MNNIPIFVFGCAVFGLTLGCTFVAIIATDKSVEKDQSE
jgi:hypothetical protein